MRLWCPIIGRPPTTNTSCSLRRRRSIQRHKQNHQRIGAPSVGLVPVGGHNWKLQKPPKDSWSPFGLVPTVPTIDYQTCGHAGIALSCVVDSAGTSPIGDRSLRLHNRDGKANGSHQLPPRRGKLDGSCFNLAWPALQTLQRQPTLRHSPSPPDQSRNLGRS